MAGRMAGRGDTAAYFLLVAFVIILICLLLTGAQLLWGEPLMLDHYLVYLVQAGLFCSVVFLGLARITGGDIRSELNFFSTTHVTHILNKTE